jgi:hypothetical protein
MVADCAYRGRFVVDGRDSVVAVLMKDGRSFWFHVADSIARVIEWLKGKGP